MATPEHARSILVELRSELDPATAGRISAVPGFELDADFDPVPMRDGTDAATTVVRGNISDDAVVAELEALPDVVRVWRDTPIAPFGDSGDLSFG